MINSHTAKTGVFTFQKTTHAEHIVVYDASDPRYGDFRLAYIPLDAVKRIISECEKILAGFTVAAPDGSVFRASEAPIKRRLAIIEQMADVATLHLLVSFRQRLCETVEDAVDDSLLIGRSLLVATAVQGIKEKESSGVMADARPEIEKAVERTAVRRRNLLREYVKLMPNILAERKRGGSRAKHNWTDTQFADLAGKYDELKVIWLDAKRIAKDAQRARSPKRNQQWREEVLRAYPELPPDLLDRFAHLRADDAKPSDIALLHAQRECGVTAPYTARELRDKIRSWKLKQPQSGSAETRDNAEPES
jgi:hypothetical protein